MKLSVYLVTWNGAKYIPQLFRSLREQTLKDWFLFVWDNNSSDNTVEAIKNEVNTLCVQYKIVENKENLGFAGGHNEVFKQCHARHSEPCLPAGRPSEESSTAEYVLLLNQDMFLFPDCLEKLMNFMDAHSEAAIVGPRLMKWNFADDIFTNIIDTMGLKIFRNRRVVDWQAGEEWSGAVTSPLQVFGISGALPMYRAVALRDVAFVNGDFFDASYHSYKEDVDLAYRLASAGFKSYVLSDVVAYHDRAGAGSKAMTDIAAVVNKKKQSARVKYHSYKNHLMTLYKNEYWQNFLLDFPLILWYEVKKFMYFLLLDRGVLAGLKEVWIMRKELREKKKWIIRKRKISWRNMRKFF
ncbi:MAG: glycosyltransferase [Candidatus Magasanikbacteria bacterium]|nr:glycosyltransferase [Candidatus Magasanikbacteria bacterium]